MVSRDRYLARLRDYMWDGQVKVITGIRRCGKSVLLFDLFHQYLLATGVPEDHIIQFELDQRKDAKFRNPIVLADTVSNRLQGTKEPFYLFIDEVQLAHPVEDPDNPGHEISIYDMLNELKGYPNLDVYVTGSNSKMLSSDIATQFRGRASTVHVWPFSFAEYHQTVGGDRRDNFDHYLIYGGMPYLLNLKTDRQQQAYLASLFREVYVKDIVERKRIRREDVLSATLDLLCSSVGSLTNPNKIANSLNSRQKLAREETVAANTVKAYIGHLIDACLFEECRRYDVKGRDYFDYPNKYYCDDPGLRNARIGFRQQEMTHIMENILYNDLRIRGCQVDIGIVYGTEKNKAGQTVQVPREIDFIAIRGSKKTYIQSAYAMEDEAKIASENKPLSLTGDSFPKIIVRHDIRKRWYDENGVLNIGIIDFLLDDTVI